MFGRCSTPWQLEVTKKRRKGIHTLPPFAVGKLCQKGWSAGWWSAGWWSVYVLSSGSAGRITKGNTKGTSKGRQVKTCPYSPCRHHREAAQVCRLSVHNDYWPATVGPKAKRIWDSKCGLKLPPPSRGIWGSSIHSMMRSSSVKPPSCTISPWGEARIGVSPGMLRAPVQPLRAGLAPCCASGLQQAAPPCSARQRRTGLACLSQLLFPGSDDLPDDLDEVIALMERDPHLPPEVRDIPLSPSPLPQLLPSMQLELPPLPFSRRRPS